jgi:hypothetical protein
VPAGYLTSNMTASGRGQAAMVVKRLKVQLVEPSARSSSSAMRALMRSSSPTPAPG